MLEPISHSSIVTRIAPLVREISPYRPVFGEKASHFLLAWDYDVPLHRPGFDALCNVLHGRGESSFIYGQIERFKHDDDDWVVSCDDFDGYRSIESFVESLLVSMEGRWAILCSSERHSLAVSADRVFVEAFALELEIDQHHAAFELMDSWHELYDHVADWSSLRPGDPDWIPNLFQVVLEPKIANEAIARHSEWIEERT